MRAIGNQEMTASPRVINRHNYVIEERSASRPQTGTDVAAAAAAAAA